MTLDLTNLDAELEKAREELARAQQSQDAARRVYALAQSRVRQITALIAIQEQDMGKTSKEECLV